MKTYHNLLLILFTLSPLTRGNASHPELEHFPEPEEGRTRSVIVLEPRKDEENLMVELIVGQTVRTDVVNVKRLGGKLRERPVKGWGYTYFVAESGPVITTLMAPRPGDRDALRFITMPGKLVPYNSKLPLVVHVPRPMEVRYRIWRAGEEQNATVDP
jgi:ecotin